MSSKDSKQEDEFFRYLIYAEFPMDAMTKSILLRDIRKANEHLIAERDSLRTRVKLLGGGEYDGLVQILLKSGSKITSLLMMLLELCQDDKEKAVVVETATNNLKAKVAAFEAKVRALEAGELPVIQNRLKESEEQIAKQKEGM